MNVFVITSELPPKKSSHVNRVQQLFSGQGFSHRSLNDFVVTPSGFRGRVFGVLKSLPFWHWIFPGHFCEKIDRSAVHLFARSLPDGARILSSSGNYLAHSVCHKIKLERPDVFWIADLGDPWSGGELFPENLPFRRAVAYVEERRSFNNVDRILVTTLELQEQLKERYSDVQYLPMGFVFDENEDFFGSAGRYVLYGGSSFSYTRNLRPLMVACNEMCLPLWIVGDVSKKYSKFKRAACLSNVEIYPRVDFEEYQFFERGAFVQVVILNKGGLQIPGKLYQCIASAPTLVVSQGSLTDEIRDICKMNSHVKIVSNDVDSITAGLKELMREKGICISDEFFEKFAWKVLRKRSRALVCG